jgi:hypothetical protein
MRWMLAAVSVAALTGEGKTQNLSGNDLLDICSDDSQAAQGFCIGYVNGLIEGLKLGAAVPMMRINQEGGTIPPDEMDALSSQFLGFCLPPEAELGQFRQIILAYLQNTPKDRHESARLLGQIALAEAYPCQ